MYIIFINTIYYILLGASLSPRWRHDHEWCGKRRPPRWDAVHVQARGGPLRAWARPGPRRTTAGLGSIQAQSVPLQAWIRRGPRRTILGLGPSWPKLIFRRPGEIQAHSGPPRIWTDPSPRQTASGLVPSRAEADWSGPGSVQMRRLTLKAMLVQGACCIPLPRWWGTQN